MKYEVKEVQKKQKIRILELFGGIGAPRAALENIGLDVKTIDYVEILRNAVKAYNVMYDLRYKPENVLDWNLNIDLLVHGSPCQDFSRAGKNDLKTGRSILYQRTLEIIEKELNPRPKYILWENVVGLVRSHKEHFNHYIKSLHDLGYKSYFDILSSCEFGIPQTRPRVFVVSIRNDIQQEFDFDVLERKPLKSLKEFLSYDKDLLENDSIIEFKQPSMIKALEENKVAIITNLSATITCNNIRWNNAGVVFKDLNFYDETKLKEFIFKPYGSLNKIKEMFPQYFKNKTYCEIFRYLTPRECWALQGYQVNVSKDYIDSINSYILPRKKDGKCINGSYNRVWKMDKLIGTINCTNVLKIGYEENNEIIYRNISSMECFKLMGYKFSQYEKVKLCGISDNDMYKLAGNSICVPVLEAIFKELLIDKKSRSNKYFVRPKQNNQNEIEI